MELSRSSSGTTVAGAWSPAHLRVPPKDPPWPQAGFENTCLSWALGCLDSDIPDMPWNSTCQSRFEGHGVDLGVSRNRGPQDRTQCIMILIRRTSYTWKPPFQNVESLDPKINLDPKIPKTDGFWGSFCSFWAIPLLTTDERIPNRPEMRAPQMRGPSDP